MRFFQLLAIALLFSIGYADTKELFVSSGEAKLFCRVFGEGDPIIVIHGGPGLSQEYLLPQMAKLSANHRVIFYDQRACGYSTGAINEEEINLDRFIEDIEAIRKTFGYKKVTVLGHSWGGFLAMHYAISHPESTDKLILLNSMAASSDELHLFLQEWKRRMAPYQKELSAIKESREFSEGDPNTMATYYRIIFKRYCFCEDKANLLNLCMTPKASIDGAKVADILRQTLLAKGFNLHDQLKALKVPTLIIHGDVDPIPACTAQNTHKSIPSSHLILLKDCGHFPFVETPDEFFRSIQLFMCK